MMDNVQQAYLCPADVRTPGTYGAFSIRIGGVPGGFPEYANTNVIPVVKNGARCRAAATAFKMLGERPDALKATRTSPPRPCSSICFENTCS